MVGSHRSPNLLINFVFYWSALMDLFDMPSLIGPLLHRVRHVEAVSFFFGDPKVITRHFQ